EHASDLLHRPCLSAQVSQRHRRKLARRCGKTNAVSSLDALIRLGDRYAALGLRNAAVAAYERAAAAYRDAPTPSRRLAELLLEAGDARAARRHAEELVKREPGPEARLLAARAQVACGEYAAARFA